MKYEEVIQLWGRKLLANTGYIVPDGETVEVDLISGQMGCECYCDTEGGIEIRHRRKTVLIPEYNFKEALHELIGIAASGANNL